MKLTDGDVCDFTKSNIPTKDHRWATPAAVFPTAPLNPVPAEELIVVNPPEAVEALEEVVVIDDDPSYDPWRQLKPNPVALPGEVKPLVVPVVYEKNTPGPMEQIILQGSKVPVVIAKIQDRRDALASVNADTTQLDWVLSILKGNT